MIWLVVWLTCILHILETEWLTFPVCSLEFENNLCLLVLYSYHFNVLPVITCFHEMLSVVPVLQYLTRARRRCRCCSSMSGKRPRRKSTPINRRCCAPIESITGAITIKSILQHTRLDIVWNDARDYSICTIWYPDWRWSAVSTGSRDHDWSTGPGRSIQLTTIIIRLGALVCAHSQQHRHQRQPARSQVSARRV